MPKQLRPTLCSDQFSELYTARASSPMAIQADRENLKSLQTILKALSGLTALMEIDCDEMLYALDDDRGDPGVSTLRLMKLASLMAAVPTLADDIAVCRNQIVPEDCEGPAGRMVFVEAR